jgi:single-strand DNA-binding protein
LAEIAGEYLKKGRPGLRRGALQTRIVEDKEASDKYTTRIVADRMQMLGQGRAVHGGRWQCRPGFWRQTERARARVHRAPARSGEAAGKPAGKFDDLRNDIRFDRTKYMA